MKTKILMHIVWVIFTSNLIETADNDLGTIDSAELEAYLKEISSHTLTNDQSPQSSVILPTELVNSPLYTFLTHMNIYDQFLKNRQMLFNYINVLHHYNKINFLPEESPRIYMNDKTVLCGGANTMPVENAADNPGISSNSVGSCDPSHNNLKNKELPPNLFFKKNSEKNLKPLKIDKLRGLKRYNPANLQENLDCSMTKSKAIFTNFQKLLGKSFGRKHLNRFRKYFRISEFPNFDQTQVQHQKDKDNFNFKNFELKIFYFGYNLRKSKIKIGQDSTDFTVFSHDIVKKITFLYQKASESTKIESSKDSYQPLRKEYFHSNQEIFHRDNPRLNKKLKLDIDPADSTSYNKDIIDCYKGKKHRIMLNKIIQFHLSTSVLGIYSVLKGYNSNKAAKESFREAIKLLGLLRTLDDCEDFISSPKNLLASNSTDGLKGYVNNIGHLLMELNSYLKTKNCSQDILPFSTQTNTCTVQNMNNIDFQDIKNMSATPLGSSVKVRDTFVVLPWFYTNLRSLSTTIRSGLSYSQISFHQTNKIVINIFQAISELNNKIMCESKQMSDSVLLSIRTFPKGVRFKNSKVDIRNVKPEIHTIYCIFVFFYDILVSAEKSKNIINKSFIVGKKNAPAENMTQDLISIHKIYNLLLPLLFFEYMDCYKCLLTLRLSQIRYNNLRLLRRAFLKTVTACKRNGEDSHSNLIKYLNLPKCKGPDEIMRQVGVNIDFLKTGMNDLMENKKTFSKLKEDLMIYNFKKVKMSRILENI